MMKKPETQDYEMTPAEFEQFKSACNPGRAVMLNAPMPLSAEERAIVFWVKMGQKYRFDPSTAEPILNEEGKHPGWFRAVPLPEPTLSDGSTFH